MDNILNIKFLASTAYTTAKTVVGDWVEVDQFHELVAWLDVTAFASRANETLDVTIERWADNTTGYTNILSFTQIATTGAHTEEKNISRFSGTPVLMGGKIRYRAVTAGTWSSKSITFSISAQAKR